MNSGLMLILDDNRGTHIPRHFVEEFMYKEFGVSEDQAEILRKGDIIENNNGSWNYNESYWEIWNEVLDNAEFTDVTGHKWRLFHDGAVWLYCEELMSEQEKVDFFFEYEKKRKGVQIQVTYHINVEMDIDADTEDEALSILDSIERGIYWNGSRSETINVEEYSNKIIPRY